IKTENTTTLEFKGLSASREGLAIKNPLVLDAQEGSRIFRVGTYKSAVEPFLRNDMSAEAKANMQRWLGEMWN
ncbi:protease IV, partial [Haemophilus influenzae HK1212]